MSPRPKKEFWMRLNAYDVFVVDSAGVTTIERREQLPWVRLWDEDWNLVRVIQAGWRIDEPEIVVLPWSDPVARMLQESCIHGLMRLTVDDGERWLGRLDRVEVVRSPDGRRTWVSAEFVDDRVRRRMLEDLVTVEDVAAKYGSLMNAAENPFFFADVVALAKKSRREAKGPSSLEWHCLRDAQKVPWIVKAYHEMRER